MTAKVRACSTLVPGGKGGRRGGSDGGRDGGGGGDGGRGRGGKRKKTETYMGYEWDSTADYQVEAIVGHIVADGKKDYANLVRLPAPCTRTACPLTPGPSHGRRRT